MEKFLIFLFTYLPMMTAAQTTLTSKQKLEQAQHQLEEAKAALKQAKTNTVEAKAEAEVRTKKEAEDRAKAGDIEKKTADMKAEAEYLSCEAETFSEAANKTQTTMAIPATKATATTTKTVSNVSLDAWVIPTTPATAAARTNKSVSTDNKVNKDIYLQRGIIPEVNDQAVWTGTFSAPGATADELYDKTFAHPTKLTLGNNQLSGSKAALVSKSEYSIVAVAREKLIFSSLSFSLDYIQFNYMLQAICRDGQATLTMSHSAYRYNVRGNVSDLSAEQWITDEYAINKKRARLLPVSGKFRRATVNHKNNIFEGFTQVLK